MHRLLEPFVLVTTDPIDGDFVVVHPGLCEHTADGAYYRLEHTSEDDGVCIKQK